MERAKIFAVTEIIIILVGALLISVYLSSYPTKQEIPNKVYMTFEEVTIQSFDVWKINDSITAVNNTSTDSLKFYQVTYNATSKEVFKVLVDIWILGSTTNKVFESNSSTGAIQWAIDNGDRVNVTGGEYIIKQPIALDSNTILDGSGSRFIAEIIPCIEAYNCTHMEISNLWIDGTFSIVANERMEKP